MILKCEWCDRHNATNQITHRELGNLQLCNDCFCELNEPNQPNQIDFLAKQRRDPVPEDHVVWTSAAASSRGENWKPKRIRGSR